MIAAGVGRAYIPEPSSFFVVPCNFQRVSTLAEVMALAQHVLHTCVIESKWGAI